MPSQDSNIFLQLTALSDQSTSLGHQATLLKLLAHKIGPNTILNNDYNLAFLTHLSSLPKSTSSTLSSLNSTQPNALPTV
jgi:hypothetical protein